MLASRLTSRFSCPVEARRNQILQADLPKFPGFRSRIVSRVTQFGIPADLDSWFGLNIFDPGRVGQAWARTRSRRSRPPKVRCSCRGLRGGRHCAARLMATLPRALHVRRSGSYRRGHRVQPQRPKWLRSQRYRRKWRGDQALKEATCTFRSIVARTCEIILSMHWNWSRSKRPVTIR
jgi:hypothetical protein